MKRLRSVWHRVVNATSLPDYPKIARTDLVTLKYDEESSRAFGRRFRSRFFASAVVALGGCPLVALLRHLQLIDDGVWALGFVGSFAFGLGLFVRTHHRMMRARPQSIRSGQDMETFIIQDRRAEGYYELAYVDRNSGTYFTAEYTGPGG